MDMIGWLQSLLMDDNTKLYVFIVVYMAITMLDFLLGFFLHIFNGTYSSKEMKIGLATKLGMILLSVVIVPIFLMFDVLGLGTLYVVLGAFIGNEVWSVISHLKGNSDGKEHSALDMLGNVISKVFGKEDENE